MSGGSVDELLKVRVVCEDLGVGVCLCEGVVEVIKLFFGERFRCRASDAQAADAGDG